MHAPNDLTAIKTPSSGRAVAPAAEAHEARLLAANQDKNSPSPGAASLNPGLLCASSSDEADAYRTHLKNYTDHYRPIGARELELVQSLADLAWRLKRVVSLEMNLYALGCEQFAEEAADRDPAERRQFLELRTFLAYEKQLRNLQTQEARLRRYSARDAAELKSLQAARQAEEETRLTEAAELYLAAKADNKSFEPAEHGFEFSTSQIERFLQTGQATSISTPTLQQGSLRTAA